MTLLMQKISEQEAAVDVYKIGIEKHNVWQEK